MDEPRRRLRYQNPESELSLRGHTNGRSPCWPSAIADLARAVSEAPDPPFWRREPGFPTLILLILEQQVSIASALATYNRLVASVGDVTPAHCSIGRTWR